MSVVHWLKKNRRSYDDSIQDFTATSTYCHWLAELYQGTLSGQSTWFCVLHVCWTSGPAEVSAVNAYALKAIKYDTSKNEKNVKAVRVLQKNWASL